MKKRSSDIEGLIVQVQQQLTYLDKKIDTLISQISARTFEAQQRPKPFERSQPFQRFDQPGRQGEVRQADNYRQRILHKAICADCNKECAVPFRPSQDRPVYCKDCFSKRKGGGSFKGRADNGPREAGPSHTGHADKPQGGGKKNLFSKKRPAVKRRKGRA